ncbi:hypothetical protein LZP69_13355 [Shewanella sp. AS1]|uniref:hypothetical protein n=1 Tax=Shewanella sp. AS1 TaxID=2907626 RepID=UPI001F1D0DC4|nr:hypothetical protein [Shewanella sp. AS1]MCE9680152.1 hypothetical protein [Shewanella sp. AS1]
MLVVTNYPQVPLATTNAATESVRVENQQRPPIIPAPQLAKSNEERAFNPQHERTAEQADIQAKRHEKVHTKGQGNQQQGGQQEQKKQQSANGYSAFFKPALKRQDIRVIQPGHSHAAQQKQQDDKDETSKQPASFYDSVSAHITRFYQTQTHPKDESALLTII